MFQTNRLIFESRDIHDSNESTLNVTLLVIDWLNVSCKPVPITVRGLDSTMPIPDWITRFEDLTVRTLTWIKEFVAPIIYFLNVNSIGSIYISLNLEEFDRLLVHGSKRSIWFKD